MIDAHLHVVDVASVQVEAHLAPSGAWWERVDPAADAVLERVRTAGVERAVLVQAIAAHGYDCSYLLSNARPGVALVGAVDPFGPDPVVERDREDERQRHREHDVARREVACRDTAAHARAAGVRGPRDRAIGAAKAPPAVKSREIRAAPRRASPG